MMATKVALALVLVCLLFVIYAPPLLHLFGIISDPCRAEWANGEIHAFSRAQLLDNFIKAHRFLEQQGFQAAAQPASPFAMKSGTITPDMITLYYAGTYQGSQ